MRFDQNKTATINHRPERPLGTTVLTMINGTFAGIMPVIYAGIGIAKGQSTLNVFLCGNLGLALLILFFSIGTWRGNDFSRLTMLMLMVIYCSFAIFTNFASLFGRIATSDQYILYGRIMRYSVWALINIWYFLRPKTIAFFRYSTKKEI